MLKVTIRLEDDKGKSAEIEISEANDHLTKLVIIQNVFDLFGIDSDIMEIVSTFNKTGEAYASFFNQVKPIEPVPTKEEIESKKETIKQQLIEGLSNPESRKEIENTYTTVNDQPEFFRLGYKIDPDGRKRYKLYYKCPACYNKGSHYIPEDAKYTWCYRCQHEMKVYPAVPKGYSEQRDTFGNFYRAGDYKDWNLPWD